MEHNSEKIILTVVLLALLLVIIRAWKYYIICIKSYMKFMLTELKLHVATNAQITVGNKLVFLKKIYLSKNLIICVWHFTLFDLYIKCIAVMYLVNFRF